MDSAVAPLVKLRFQNFHIGVASLYTQPEHTANKIDLGCTCPMPGETGEGKGSDERREDKVKAVGQVRPYCWTS